MTTPLTGQALTNEQNMVSVSNNLAELETALANALSAVKGDSNATAALTALSNALTADIVETIEGIANGYSGAANTNGN